jgi:hypothetical protein
MKTTLLASAFLLAASAPALAEYYQLMQVPSCTATPDGVQLLATRFGETLVSTEVSEVDGQVYQFYANGATGDFTLVRLSPDGHEMCAVAYGQANNFLALRL